MRRLVALIALAAFATGAAAQTPAYPPAADEPLHIVRHRSAAFLIYTNHIAPGMWTQFHSHRNDLLAMIAADTRAASQKPDAPIDVQRAPAGAAVFFPYADAATAFVHRVGVEGDAPFVNVGLEFLEAPAGQCAQHAPWQSVEAAPVARNRRGFAYRLSLPAGHAAALPAQGRGLLIVPLPASGEVADLALDGARWQAAAGDFRFFDATQNATRAQRLHNAGATAQAVTLFVVC